MYTDLDTDCERLLDPPESTNFDTAGELFRNIVRMAEGPLNPPILGDFEDMPPQNWGLGGLKKPPLQRQYFQVLNSPAASILGDFEFMLPQSWGLGEDVRL